MCPRESRHIDTHEATYVLFRNVLKKGSAAMLLKNLTVAAVVIFVSTQAEAGVRYVYPAPVMSYYGATTYYSAPVAAAPTAGTGAITVSSGHTLVPAAAADGTRSYAVYQPGLGFTGWLQLIGGVWQFIQSNGAGGLGGGSSQDITAIKQDVASIKADLATIKADIAEIKAKLPTIPNPPAGAGGTAPPAR
jgi:hypothetical protein